MEITRKDIELMVHEPVESFTLGKGSNSGDNLCSELFRIEVKTESGNTFHLVYKKFPSEEGIKKYAVDDKLFRRETTFYNEFAPNILSTVKSYLHLTDEVSESEQINLKEELQLPIPVYFAGFNDDENDFVCLEDLRPRGFKMPDKTTGLTTHEFSLTLKKLAKFHALSYFYLNYEGENLFQRIDNYKLFLTKQATVTHPQIFEKLLQNVYKNSVQIIRNHGIGSDKENLASKMEGENGSVIESVYDIITSTTLNTDLKYFPLLIHGDLWINNLLISYNSNNEPTDVKFVDFQFARRGNIYEDLNYLVSTSTTAELRKQYLYKALNIYYDTFISTLRIIKFPAPANFSRDQFLNDFNGNILPSYLYLSLLIPIQLGAESEDGSLESEYTVELVKKMERSPLALRRWEEAMREVVQMNII